MSPARLAPSPQSSTPGGGAAPSAPGFFLNLRLFLLQTLPSPTWRITCKGRSWAIAQAVSVVGQRSRLLCPSWESLLWLELTWPSGAFPAPPACPSHPPWGPGPLCPCIAGRRDGSSQWHFCQPFSLSCAFPGQEWARAWGGAAGQHLLGSVVSLAAKSGFCLSWGWDGPCWVSPSCAGLCCSIPVPVPAAPLSLLLCEPQMCRAVLQHPCPCPCPCPCCSCSRSL